MDGEDPVGKRKLSGGDSSDREGPWYRKGALVPEVEHIEKGEGTRRGCPGARKKKHTRWIPRRGKDAPVSGKCVWMEC